MCYGEGLGLEELGIMSGKVMSDILVSIITITYNAGQFIERTIQSVLTQKYAHIEYIIIDGASQDDTLNIIEKYKGNIDVVISEKDRGISDAFNKGVRCAHGQLIMFLNAGDVIVNSGVVDKVVNDWRTSRSDVIFYKVKVGENTLLPANSLSDDSEKIWRNCEIPHQGAFIKREIFDLVGGFNICLKTRMDYDFWARCMKNNCSYLYIPEIIVNYEVGGTSMQINNAELFYREGLAVKLMYQLPVGCMDIIQLLIPKSIRGLVRKLIKR